MASSNRKVMNLNSLLKGADDKTKERPTSAFSKPTMSKLAAFEFVKKVKDEKPKEVSAVSTSQTNNNKISELIDKANETRVEENKEEMKKIPLKEADIIKRPRTANNTQRKSSWFSKQSAIKNGDSSTDSESSSGISSEVSSSDDEEQPTIAYNRKITMLGSKSPAVNKNKGYKGKWNKSSKFIDVTIPQRVVTTPQTHKRSILVTGAKGANGDNHVVIQPIVLGNPIKPKANLSINPLKLKNRNVMMTPSQILGNDRKLMPIGLAGLPIFKNDVKEEHHAQNLKPSAEFFSFDILNYPNLIKDNDQTSKLWAKSFAEAINDIKIENKEQLSKIDAKFKRRFACRDWAVKKTIVFGLDRVLVKTSFEKEGDEYRQANLLLNEKTGAKIKIYVCIRPYVANTLKQLKRANYEIILYSTSQYNYTNAILEVLNRDFKIDFQHIITAEDHSEALMSCPNPSKNIINSKNMKLLLHDRKERDIIFVDCKVQDYAYQMTNGIFIPPYEGPPNENNPEQDEFFNYLFEYLKDFQHVFDVRNKIERDFDLKNLFLQSFKNPALQ